MPVRRQETSGSYKGMQDAAKGAGFRGEISSYEHLMGKEQPAYKGSQSVSPPKVDELSGDSDRDKYSSVSPSGYGAGGD